MACCQKCHLFVRFLLDPSHQPHVAYWLLGPLGSHAAPRCSDSDGHLCHVGATLHRDRGEAAADDPHKRLGLPPAPPAPRRPPHLGVHRRSRLSRLRRRECRRVHAPCDRHERVHAAAAARGARMGHPPGLVPRTVRPPLDCQHDRGDLARRRLGASALLSGGAGGVAGAVSRDRVVHPLDLRHPRRLLHLAPLVAGAPAMCRHLTQPIPMEGGLGVVVPAAQAVPALPDAAVDAAPPPRRPRWRPPQRELCADQAGKHRTARRTAPVPPHPLCPATCSELTPRF